MEIKLYLSRISYTKSKLLASNRPDTWPLDAKIFDFKFSASKTIQIEDFDIQGPSKLKLLASSRPDRWPLDVKIVNLKTLASKNILIEDFNILGSSKSKLLPSSQPGSLDVKIFKFARFWIQKHSDLIF